MPKKPKGKQKQVEEEAQPPKPQAGGMETIPSTGFPDTSAVLGGGANTGDNQHREDNLGYPSWGVTGESGGGGWDNPLPVPPPAPAQQADQAEKSMADQAAKARMSVDGGSSSGSWIADHDSAGTPYPSQSPNFTPAAVTSPLSQPVSMAAASIAAAEIRNMPKSSASEAARKAEMAAGRGTQQQHNTRRSSQQPAAGWSQTAHPAVNQQAAGVVAQKSAAAAAAAIQRPGVWHQAKNLHNGFDHAQSHAKPMVTHWGQPMAADNWGQGHAQSKTAAAQHHRTSAVGWGQTSESGWGQPHRVQHQEKAAKSWQMWGRERNGESNNQTELHPRRESGYQTSSQTKRKAPAQTRRAVEDHWARQYSTTHIPPGQHGAFDEYESDSETEYEDEWDEGGMDHGGGGHNGWDQGGGDWGHAEATGGQGRGGRGHTAATGGQGGWGQSAATGGQGGWGQSATTGGQGGWGQSAATGGQGGWGQSAATGGQAGGGWGQGVDAWGQPSGDRGAHADGWGATAATSHQAQMKDGWGAASATHHEKANTSWDAWETDAKRQHKVTFAQPESDGNRNILSPQQRSQILNSLLNTPQGQKPPQHAGGSQKHPQNQQKQSHGGKQSKDKKNKQKTEGHNQGWDADGGWGAGAGDGWGAGAGDRREASVGEGWGAGGAGAGSASGALGGGVDDSWGTSAGGGWGSGADDGWGADGDDDGWEAIPNEKGKHGKWEDDHQIRFAFKGHEANWGGSQAENYTMPSKTLTHAYKGTTTTLNVGIPRNSMNGFANVRFVESKGAALEPVKNALFGKSRLVRDRIHWMFSPNKDERVASLLTWIQTMSYNLGALGLHKFLQSRERGALIANAEYRHPDHPKEPAFDWLTFDQLQYTMDKTMQESVAFYDPSIHVIVFVFLPSKTGNSVAMWRRKITVPNNTRLMLQGEIGVAMSGLRKEKDYVVYVDELPKVKNIAHPRLHKGKAGPVPLLGKAKKKRKWWQFFSKG